MGVGREGIVVNITVLIRVVRCVISRGRLSITGHEPVSFI